jgi:hypothetical protein
MKTSADAFDTAEKEPLRAKLENWTRRPRYRKKNEFGNAKLENGTRCPRYHRK